MGTKKLGEYWTRDNPRGVDSLTDDCPQWLYDALMGTHLGTLPHDWIYTEVRAVCERIDEGAVDDDGEWIHEHADSRVDVYTRARYEWAAAMHATDLFALAEQEVEDMGANTTDPAEAIGWVQYAAIRMICGTIFDAYRDQRDDEENEEADEGADED